MKIHAIARNVFLTFGLIVSGTIFASMTATAAPLVPIVSFLQHWDHHWYVWLPSDPVYEAVEIMAAERDPNRPPCSGYSSPSAPCRSVK